MIERLAYHGQGVGLLCERIVNNFLVQKNLTIGRILS